MTDLNLSDEGKNEKDLGDNFGKCFRSLNSIFRVLRDTLYIERSITVLTKTNVSGYNARRNLFHSPAHSHFSSC